MKKEINIFTVSYPYYGEYFLDNEVESLIANGYKVNIIPTRLSRREIAKNYDRRSKYINDVNVVKLNLYKFNILSFFYFILRLGPVEFKKSPRLGGLVKLFYRAFMGACVYGFCESRYFQNTILYSYWLNHSALAFAKLANEGKYKNKYIARAHGSDIYDHNPKTGFNYYKNYIIQNLDLIFCISQSGKEYLKGFNDFSKIVVNRIGVNVPKCEINTIDISKNNSNSLKIVSCSSVDKNKRVLEIYKAILRLKNNNIEWHHFGDGPEYDTLKSMSSSNEKVVVHGHVSNKLLNDIYSKGEFSIFVNFSLSEGIPVSIMEAMSHSIPVIAPNIGAVSEIVNNENGWLIPENTSVENLSKLIDQIYISILNGENVYEKKRKLCYQTIFENFNKSQVSNDFISSIGQL